MSSRRVYPKLDVFFFYRHSDRDVRLRLIPPYRGGPL
jgi:hypothetical protein